MAVVIDDLPRRIHAVIVVALSPTGIVVLVSLGVVFPSSVVVLGVACVGPFG